MKIVFLVLVCLHALIHLVGFAKGWQLAEVKGLTLPVSRTMGWFWLLAFLLLTAFLVLFAMDNVYSWVPGLLALLLSQGLVIAWWKDAKWGSMANGILLVVVIFSWAAYCFNAMEVRERMAILNANQIIHRVEGNATDIIDLPLPVQRWLQASGAMKQPFIHQGRIVQEAEMQLKPGPSNWMKAQALQYTTVDQPAFIWTVDVKMNSIMHFVGRDQFHEGKGAMLIKMNALFPMVNATGKKLDEASMQRFLGEMAWFPSLALSPYITWEAVNDTTARATMRYQGTSATGSFHFDQEGNFRQYSALRYKDNDAQAKRYEWIMQAQDYQTFQGIRVPSVLTATWKLDTGSWTWLKLRVKDIRYNDTAE